MDVKDIVTTKEAVSGFFPTPKEIAKILLHDVKLNGIKTVLEPSAGKGDLVKAISNMFAKEYVTSWGSVNGKADIDCIEYDPYLRSILQYEFSNDRLEELRSRIPEEYSHDFFKFYRDDRYKDLRDSFDIVRVTNMKIIHDDFLNFNSRKKYDLIVMNPPFSNGDEHLLKAISIQEKYGGMIRCILNAETILNPYSKIRRELAKKLEMYGADISFHDNAFSDGERRTDVRIAIISIYIPSPYEESDIYSKLQKAQRINEDYDDNVTDLTVSDFIGQIVSRFDVEVSSGLELIREYKAMCPYILQEFGDKSYGNKPILSLTITDSNTYSPTPDINEFVRAVRLKYWKALFSNKELTGKMTTNILEKYRKMINELADYDFTLFNIQQIVHNMNSEMGKGIQDTIVALFDRMTEQHSYYPECSKNIHYFNGWKTNKVHKINNKVIIPVNGMFSCYSWERDEFNAYKAEETISDIEKVFDYLDGNMTASVDLHSVIQNAKETGCTKNINCKYFSVSIYKKGTMHIKFNNQDLVDKFNIYCCSKKNWLPPTYGKKQYTDLDTEEKAVIDEFNGNGTDGSGMNEYNKIISKSEYFLQEPTNQKLMISM